MKTSSSYFIGLIILILSNASWAQKPELAFTCNSQIGGLPGQVQLFSSGHSRIVFRENSKSQLHSCWLKAQYVNDFRGTRPGGLLTDFYRSSHCQPGLDKNLAAKLPEALRLAVQIPLNEKPKAFVYYPGAKSEVPCQITANRINAIEHFAVYDVPEQRRGIASFFSQASPTDFPTIDLWWHEEEAQ